MLGVGAGVPGDEEVVRGAERRGKEQAESLAETVEAIAALWAGALSWSGAHLQVEGVTRFLSFRVRSHLT